MFPGFTANAALAGPRNAYHGRGLHELTDFAITPQEKARVLGVEGVRADCVCPCCLYVPGLGLRCCNSV